MTTTTAHYELDGRVYVTTTSGDGSTGEDDLGFYDADGDEWAEPVAAMLDAAGYTVTGQWETDADYDSTIAVRDRDQS